MTTVLLYSGGMDSYAAAHLYAPDVLLHVPLGGQYGAAETAALRTPPGMADRVVVHPLAGLTELPGSLIVPGRNAHLCLLAAQYGDRILLGATKGDRVHDKNERFAELMTALLTHLYAPQWWIPAGRAPRVELPMKGWSKTRIVAEYLRAGGTAARLVADTFSCYAPTPTGAPCGACKPCVRRYVALLNNGITPDVDCHAALAPLAQAATSTGWDRGEDERRDVLQAWEASTVIHNGAPAPYSHT